MMENIKIEIIKKINTAGPVLFAIGMVMVIVSVIYGVGPKQEIRNIARRPINIPSKSWQFSPITTGGSQCDQNGLMPFTVYNQNIMTLNCGLYMPAIIGDFVWLDKNGNGIQNNGEPGMPGVTVNLLNDQAAIVDTVLTDSIGEYSFVTRPGTYQVECMAPASPLGYEFTTRYAPGMTLLDSDADPNTGLSDAFTIISNEDIYSVDCGFKENLFRRIISEFAQRLGSRGAK